MSGTTADSWPTWPNVERPLPPRPMRPFLLRVGAEMDRAIREYAAKERRPVSWVIRDLIRAGLRQIDTMAGAVVRNLPPSLPTEPEENR